MTGKTIPGWTGKIPMPAFQSGSLMTGQAQSVTRVNQQLEIFRLMGTMTGHAPSLCIRLMGHRVLPGQLVMAGKTVRCRIVPEKPLSACHMWGMTGAAVAPGNGIMNNAPGKELFLLPVTGVAENILPVAKQSPVLGDMGIMADITAGIGNRFMYHLAGKPGCIVAPETGNIGCLRRIYRQERNSNQVQHDEN